MCKRWHLGWIGALLLGAVGVLTLGSVTATEAATYYVATTGDDNATGTGAQPLRTLRKGAGKLRAGDTLIIKAGTYRETLLDVFPSGTSWSQAVTVRAEQGATVTLSPPAKTDLFLSFVGSNTQYIIFDGLIIDGQKIASYGVYISDGAEHIRLVNCTVKNALRQGILVSPGQQPGNTRGCCNEFLNINVHDNGTQRQEHGIYVATSNNLIEHSRFYRNAGYGVSIYHAHGGVNNNIIRYSEVYDNNVFGNAAGVVLASGTNNAAYNNLIWNNRSGMVIASSGAKVYNNTIYNNNRAGGDDIGIVIQKGATGVAVKNNIIYRHGYKPIDDATSQADKSHNLVNTDPGFVSEANFDFHLRPGSPAIDAGFVLSEIRDDLDGVPRPRGARPDIGAYEYTTSNVPSQLPAPRNLRVVSQP
ncbi:MAG: right-handed parallel beta-helix repeat-containing protein [Candidatus Tectimicrobiota bacterium]